MARNEKTSPEVAKIAARGLLHPDTLTGEEIKTLAASALTQVADRPLEVDLDATPDDQQDMPDN